MKLTPQQVAFTLETIAHLAPSRLPQAPGVEQHTLISHLLLAAKIVRKASDKQLAEAVDAVIGGA